MRRAQGHIRPPYQKSTEAALEKRFKNECNKRHNKRSDVKKNDHAQLKIKEWKELLAKIIEKMPDGTSMNQCKRLCFDWCKKTAEDAHEAMKESHPDLYKGLKEVAREFKEWKRIQAEEGDARGIPCPHPKRTGVEVQYLHQIFPKNNRFFICRNLSCSDEGCFFGYNTDWISTCAAGGWKFACPHCGQPYGMNLHKKTGSCQRTTFGTSRRTRASCWRSGLIPLRRRPSTSRRR